MQTAEITKTGEFEGKLQSDIIFNNGGGFNFISHLKTGLVDNFLDLDLLVGTGTTNFQAGGLVKYSFLPDIDGQVGLSFYGGASFIRDDLHASSYNFYLITTGALISKSVRFSQVLLTPYTSIQYEMLLANKLPDKYPWTLLLGSKWQPKHIAPWNFYSEFGFSIHRSVYSFSIGAGYPF
jgi:hypothetical protein